MVGATGALIGSALFGAGASILGGNSRRRASDRAAAEARGTASENNALSREFYGRNLEILDPYNQEGRRASATLSGLLLGPGAADSAAPPSRSAWDTFRDSTNYQFRLDEGARAINQGYAAAGSLQSGAATKALTRYNQDYASNELSNYMNLLGNQQNMGLNAARAVAGVGGDLVSQVSANNNSAGTAAANAALIRGNANADMWDGIGGGFSRALGALGGSSYARNPYGIANGGGGIY